MLVLPNCAQLQLLEGAEPCQLARFYFAIQRHLPHPHPRGFAMCELKPEQIFTDESGQPDPVITKSSVNIPLMMETSPHSPTDLARYGGVARATTRETAVSTLHRQQHMWGFFLNFSEAAAVYAGIMLIPRMMSTSRAQVHDGSCSTRRCTWLACSGMGIISSIIMAGALAGQTDQTAIYAAGG